jgi:exoribonuclease II
VVFSSNELLWQAFCYILKGMTDSHFSPDSLIVYKKHPARLLHSAGKLEIELADGASLRVRPKDILLLHPGPISSQALRVMSTTQLPTGDIETAWEILSQEAGEGQPITFLQLAELVYGEFTPATAWACWLLLEDGLYFTGSPHSIQINSREEIEREADLRQARAVEQQAWQDFVQRAHSGAIIPLADKRYFSELEDLAFGRRTDSRLLRELGQSESSTTAHARLLDWAVWDEWVDPYPQRFDLPIFASQAVLPDLPDEARLDLTHLPAFAIDDQGNQDPDDALSLDDDRLWVHVADVAALVTPDSPADQEARRRGANLYLPEGTVNMLPSSATSFLGLGLNKISPALSFGFVPDDEGKLRQIEIAPSWVQVQRLSYEQADQILEAEAEDGQAPLSKLEKLALVYRQQRLAAGAIEIDLPETIVRVVNDGKDNRKQVAIRPVLPSRSRVLVKEAMLMAGEAAARFATGENFAQRQIPFPFTTQESPDPSILQRLSEGLYRSGGFPPPGQTTRLEPDLARAFALRKAQKRGLVSSRPGPHAGLGLEIYTRVTSPLRRYADLAAHHQLRAFLSDQPLLNESELLERVSQGEAAALAVSQCEGMARRHWSLVYLKQQLATDWYADGKGHLDGVLVEKRALRGRVLIPELALEENVNLRQDLPLNAIIPLRLKGINLPLLEANFAWISVIQ